MRFISPKDLINSTEFVREPVGTVCRDLDILEKNTILKGEGRGKSVVLAHMQNKKAGTEIPFINAWFALSSLGVYNNFLKEDFFRHYREIQFSFQLLSYLEQYYEIIYNKHFLKIKQFLMDLDNKTMNYLNNFFYDDSIKLEKLLSTGEISGEILDSMKKYCHLYTIELGIDNFDKIDNGRKLTQHILKDYFSLFNKVILSIHDDTIKEHQDYDIKTLDYGMDMQTIRLILTKRIDSYNYGKEKQNQFTLDWLTDDLIRVLIEKTNGNLKVMLDILEEIAERVHFYKRFNDSIFNDSLEDKLELTRGLKKLQHPPKFYI